MRCSVCKATSDGGVLMHELGCAGETVEQKRATARVTADTITDEQICDLADEIRRDVVSALGEEEGGGLPPSHPLVKAAKRRLIEILNARHAKDGES